MVMTELPLEGRTGLTIVDQDWRARGTRGREEGIQME